MNSLITLNYVMLVCSCDSMLSDFSTSFYCSLEEYSNLFINVSAIRFANINYGFHFCLLDSLSRIFSFIRPISIDLFPEYETLFIRYFDRFCFYMIFYLFFDPPTILIYLLYLMYLPKLASSDIVCFIEDFILCNSYFQFIIFKNCFYENFGIYYFILSCSIRGFFYLFFESTISYKSCFLWIFNYFYNFLMDLIIQPAVYPLWGVLIFLFKNFFFLIYDLSYFIFQPTFFKLFFYYCWCSCPGSLPDGFVYFLSSYMGPFFIFIFKYTQVIFLSIHYVFLNLYYFPFHFDVIIYFIVVDFITSIFLVLCMPIKLFFLLFNFNLFPFNLIYYFYSSAVIFIDDYFLIQCCFCFFTIFKVFIFLLFCFIQSFFIIYIAICKLILSNFFYYYPAYCVDWGVISSIIMNTYNNYISIISVNVYINVYSNTCREIWNYFINLFGMIGCEFFKFVQCYLQELKYACSMIVFVLDFFYGFMMFVSSYFNYFSFTCGLHVLLFLKSILLSLKSILLFLKSNCYFYYKLYYKFILSHYGGFRSFKYCYIVSFVIHLNCIIYSSYKIDTPVTAGLAYKFTSRLLIIYIISFMPVFLLHYYIYIYSSDGSLTFSNFNFYKDIVFNKTNYVVSTNMAAFWVFLAISGILKVLKLRDNILFLLLNYFVLVHVIGLFWRVTGSDYFQYGEFIFDGVTSLSWAFRGSYYDCSVLHYWSNAPAPIKAVSMVNYTLVYIYLFYLLCRIYLGVFEFYILSEFIHKYYILKYDSVDHYGVRSVNEDEFFENRSTNMSSSLMSEVLLKTSFERGWDFSYLRTEPAFIIELYRVIKCRLFREYMKMIEKYTVDNLDSNKTCLPVFDTSMLKLSNLTKEEIDSYSEKLMLIDGSDFLACSDRDLFNFFNLRFDRDILKRVTFVDITYSGLKITYNDSLVTWEKDVNNVCSTIVFKIKGRYNCCIVQEFFTDEFLLTTYCIHIMKILKGDLRICGDCSKMYFFFTRYFHLSPDESNPYSEGHFYDGDFSYAFLNSFSGEEFSIDCDYNKYMRYICRENDSRTILDYLGYYSNKDEFFFSTIFYKNNLDSNFETQEDLTARQKSLTKFLNDDYTEITFSGVSKTFLFDAIGPTTQEFEDNTIHIRQCGYDHKIIPAYYVEMQEKACKDFYDVFNYISYAYNGYILRKKIGLLLPYFDKNSDLLSNSIFIEKVRNLSLDNILPVCNSDLKCTGTEYSKLNKLVLNDLKSIIVNNNSLK